MLRDVIRSQDNTRNIRNICIIAHVDHGKTTLTDSLIASNGIISQKLAGSVRYMDNRKDEQERQITMKSSNISLLFRTAEDDQPYLVNLIDSPGHVDFGGEVSSAVRAADGALVVVDAVEGVCNQTHTVLRQAFQDQVKPCLVINKLDRLITELKLDPESAYVHLNHILESVNVVMATLFTESELGKEDLEEIDDSEVYFSPERGNVLFASAKFGWGFRIHHFADTYAKRLKMNRQVLLKTLWGEYYFSPKDKSIKKTSNNGKYERMFVQFVLKNIWHLYNAVLEEKSIEKVEKIIQVLQLNIPERELRILRDNKGNLASLLTTICRQWMPLSSGIIRMVIEQLPNPIDAQHARFASLLDQQSTNPDIQKEYAIVRDAIRDCKNGEDDPVVVFVSKVYAIPAADTVEAASSGIVRISMPKPKAINHDSTANPLPAPENTEEVQPDESGERFIGFARIFSGVLKKGSKVFILGPRYDPAQPEENISEFTVEELYLMMGRGLEPIDRIPAGNIFGIGGVKDKILKTATISSTKYCYPFNAVQFSQPIVRVAVEAENPNEMPILIRGLKKLNQADASVEVYIQETGEYVIATVGEMHLQRCLRDLSEMFAPIPLEVSPPIVSFKETITQQGKQVQFYTRGKICTMKLYAKPLPPPIVEFIESHQPLMREIFTAQCNPNKHPKFLDIQSKLLDAFVKSGSEWTREFGKIWAFGPKHVGPNILFNSIPGYCESEYWKSPCSTENAIHLRNRIGEDSDEESNPDDKEDEQKEALNEEELWKYSMLQNLERSIRQGFDLAALTGPLCEEPLSGVSFFIEEFDVIHVEQSKLNAYGPFKGQIIATFSQALRQAFENASPRLIEPYYQTSMQFPEKYFGDATAVLCRRRAKIKLENFIMGTDLCEIEAELPVVESFGFGDEIMRKTSGSARTQLQFSHWSILDEDPNWVPTTEDEKEEFGMNASAKGENFARQLVDDVRRRKGLFVEEKLVEHGDKQRTLSKKK